MTGLPLKSLTFPVYGKVKDLSPLHGMKLERFHAFRSQIEDISPLRDMPLRALNVSEAQVADFDSVERMPLEHLDIGRGNLSPALTTLPLKSLNLVFRLHFPQDEEFLRKLKLDAINGMRRFLATVGARGPGGIRVSATGSGIQPAGAASDEMAQNAQRAPGGGSSARKPERSVGLHPYRVIYRYEPATDCIFILAVLHSRRDLSKSDLA